eukprot:CAMPEP_0204387542 /NCGR_PEP_ID=MMETSP0469-20131031/59008_1 /ASSEMBLY_ACC=CAM_ASM_000384 /TAXON_ID=2969 /ORGANISM="Oxyrrhis marina" /LENGTH=32 /DNA_ID= /DNA_START= /DNA_END= /DNA_ORIENTATION=
MAAHSLDRSGKPGSRQDAKNCTPYVTQGTCKI